MENLKPLLNWLRSLPRWARIVVIAVVAALTFVLSFTSCSRSLFAVRGTGDFEYIYEGANPPRNDPFDKPVK